ncbi:MAG: DUF1501 domain-containing protein [Planctomycetota bacterium]
MDPLHEHLLSISRRQFFGRASVGIGTAALAALVDPTLLAAPSRGDRRATGGLATLPHFAPRAKRVIYLFQSGAPAQMDLLDHKPTLAKRQGTELPDSVRDGQRLTGMTSEQDSFPVAASRFGFARHGACGAWVSELLPNTARIVDRLCIVRSMHTEAINHDPGITFFQTGSQQPGRPCFGSWISYGLGSENRNLPAFVVLISQGSSKRDSQPLFSRLWGSGFLPADHQGVQFRSGRDPVLYLNNPAGIDAGRRRAMLDRVAALNRMQYEQVGDPEITARIRQYEMAYRMQTSVPDLMDVADEPDEVFELYGADARRPGTYAANCLLARRLVERDVRFVQLYHRGWDQHENLPGDLPLQCRDTDRASAALVLDLERRGLLDDTLVIWGGEFGRTVYCQGPLTEDNYGRDHHPRCFTIWMAGGGVRAGLTYGETDDYSYNIVRDPVHVHDLQATILHCLGIDHERLAYPFQGRDFRLTDVHGRVVDALLA